MKLTDLTTKQLMRVDRNVGRMLETTQCGCVVPVNNMMVYISPTDPYLHIRSAAWMLAKGETPPFRLRAKCRTVNCCNVDHLERSDWSELKVPKIGEKRVRTTPLQQYQAYEMSLDPKNRLVDIAITLDIPPHRANDAIKRERIRREKKVSLREAYLLDLKEARL